MAVLPPISKKRIPLGKQLFGTDGIRGVAGEYPLDPATVYAFGVALAGDALRNHGSGGEPPRILIGADTRESGPWIAGMVAGGLASRGVAADYAGVITTPGVAYLTRTGPYCAGVMISASHNPFRDNGIKVFSHSGFKLPDNEEHEIESEILRLREAGVTPKAAELMADDSLDERYLDFLLSTVSDPFRRHAHRGRLRQWRGLQACAALVRALGGGSGHAERLRPTAATSI